MVLAYDLAYGRTLRRMAEVSDDSVASAKADSEFHMTIARATRNPYYLRLIDFLGVRLVPPRSLYLRDQPPRAHQEYVEKVLRLCHFDQLFQVTH